MELTHYSNQKHKLRKLHEKSQEQEISIARKEVISVDFNSINFKKHLFIQTFHYTNLTSDLEVTFSFKNLSEVYIPFIRIIPVFSGTDYALAYLRRISTYDSLYWLTQHYTYGTSMIYEEGEYIKGYINVDIGSLSAPLDCDIILYIENPYRCNEEQGSKK